LNCFSVQFFFALSPLWVRAFFPFFFVPNKTFFPRRGLFFFSWCKFCNQSVGPSSLFPPPGAQLCVFSPPPPVFLHQLGQIPHRSLGNFTVLQTLFCVVEVPPPTGPIKFPFFLFFSVGALLFFAPFDVRLFVKIFDSYLDFPFFLDPPLFSLKLFVETFYPPLSPCRSPPFSSFTSGPTSNFSRFLRDWHQFVPFRFFFFFLLLKVDPVFAWF